MLFVNCYNHLLGCKLHDFEQKSAYFVNFYGGGGGCKGVQKYFFCAGLDYPFHYREMVNRTVFLILRTVLKI